MPSEIEALRAQAASSEEKFHKLFTAMGEGACLHEMVYDGSGMAVDYRILDANPAYELITGFKKETVVGTLASKIYRTDTPPFLETYARVAASGQPECFTVYWQPLAKHFRISVFVPAQGQFATIFADITEKYHAEQYLQESQEELVAIYDNAPLLLMLLDQERRVRKVNGVAGEFAGCPTRDLIGLRSGEALRCVNALHAPEGCGFGPDCAHCAIRLAVVDTLETGCSHHQVEASLPFGLEGRDLRLTFLLSTTRLILRQEPMVLVSIMDITRRKQAEEALREGEERFKMLFSNVPVPYQSLDGEGNFLEVNPAWLATLGYRREEVIGRNFSEFILPDWREHFKAQFPRFKTLGEVMGVEFEMLKKNGESLIASFTGKIGHDAEAHFRQTHCIFQDITAQRNARNEMAKLEERLQQAQKMEAIGTLAGGIAHDFNNMLFPLVGFAEMLKEDLPPDSPLQENVNEILHAAFRSRELVQQILAFSRKAERKDKPIRLQSIVKEAIKLLRATIPTTIEIKQQIDGECPLAIADPTHIHQIVMNLATNAYHAMEEKGGVLSIMLEAVRLESDPAVPDGPAAGLYAHLRIADTGLGMTKEVLARVFDPYFTTKSDGKGTGLGLSVVHGIVATYRGDVRIYSEPGLGTEVHVYLPVVEKKLLKEDPAVSAPVRGGSERILLVDDEETIVRMEQQVLTRLGYQVTVRTASIEALAAFKAYPEGFDLLLTDMTMPNMTGTQLAAAVKAIRPDIPVIICTGFSEQIDEARSAALGIAGYLMKPVDSRVLAETVRKTLDACGRPS
jgi:PAS domain S-box-containing protein